MNMRTAVTAFRISQALMLVNSLASLVDVGTPLPPRKPTSRDMTLATSLRVIGEELERALTDLEEMEVRRTA
jgi:hypothetical protein